MPCGNTAATIREHGDKKMRSTENTIKRWQAARERQSKWQSMARQAYSVAMPERNPYDRGDEGQDRTQGLYDSSAITAANSFAATMLRLMFPPDTQFAKISPGPLIPPEAEGQVQALLDAANDIHFNALKASNFQVEIVPFLYDLFIGTACMIIQQGTDTEPLTHKAIPMDQISFEEDSRGEISAAYREWECLEEEIPELWPQGSHRQEGDRDGLPRKKSILETAYREPGNPKWQYKVISLKDKKEIYSRQMNYNPFIISRWTSISGEINGRGPLLQALPEFQFLNRLRYFASEGLPYRIFPLLTVTDDDAMDADKFILEPGRLNKVERNGGPNGPSIQPLQYGGDISYEQYNIEDLRANIKKLTLDDQMPPTSGAARTATEWASRAQELRQDRTVAFSRIQSEVIRKIFKAQINILYDMGAFPREFYQNFKPQDINSFVLKMDIESPIAKQDKAEEAGQAFQILQAMLQTDPDATRAVFRIEDMFEQYGRALGIKSRFVRTAEERALIQKQAAEQAAMQQQQAAMAAAIQQEQGGTQ